MNYKLIYNNLIQKYRKINLKYDKTTERHHIIPRCIGGNDNSDNLIVVPTRVHYILHLLLWKIKDYSYEQHIKLTNALFCMSKLPINNKGRRKIKINSKLYEIYSNQRKKYMSEKCKKWGSVTPGIHFTKGHLGHKHSEETRIKMSKKRKPSNKFGRKKKWFWVCNPITKQNINIFIGEEIPKGFVRGRIISEESKLKNRLKHLSKTVSQETKHKQSVNIIKAYQRIDIKEKHKKAVQDSFNNRKSIRCPYCGKTSKMFSVMKSKHFDNCKYKNSIENIQIINVIRAKNYGNKINGLVLKDINNTIFIAKQCLYNGLKLYISFNENQLIGKYVSIAFINKIKNQDGSWSLRFPVLKTVYENERDM